MIVTVVDRAATDAAWGHPGPGGVVLRTVEIADACPACGGDRGRPVPRRFCEDGEWYDADCWANPCGHVDKYAAVLAEAAAAAAEGGAR